MSGFAVSRSHSGDRFYNPPIRRNQNHHHQQKLPPAAETRTESDDRVGALSSVCSSSPPRQTGVDVTNLDRFLDSVTPHVPSRSLSSEARVRGSRSHKSELNPSYCLGDLWEAFSEWSAYGAGVPLMLNGKDSIIQYYVPFLSGMQLYVDPSKPRTSLRRSAEGSDAESSRETSSCGSSDYEADRQSKSVLNGSSSQHDHANLNFQQLNRLSLSDKVHEKSPSDQSKVSKSPGLLAFEYMEHEQPHTRKPLTDKISVLASQFPELKMYRSSDLLPSSWICVAWYPIYRIPVGPTLKALEASFLTFHSLSIEYRSNVQSEAYQTSGRKVRVAVGSSIPLPIFGLASYKLKGSIISPCGPQECEQENALLQAAGNWLQRLQVYLPDYQFFLSHYSHRR